ncbi:hypothetical protein KEM48_009530, partial [Puccinia striiformis f. sp. tritici PST-130]
MGWLSASCEQCPQRPKPLSTKAASLLDSGVSPVTPPFTSKIGFSTVLVMACQIRHMNCFDYDSQRIINVHDVTFDENNFPEREDNDPNPFIIKQEEETPEQDPVPQIPTNESDDESDSEIIPTIKAIKVIPPKATAQSPRQST